MSEKKSIIIAARLVGLLLVFGLSGNSVAGGAKALELLPAAQGDLSVAQVKAAEQPLAAVNDSREPVSFSWAVQGGEAAVSPPLPYEATSREFWVTVPARELKAGVSIDTVAPGAVVKISPITPESPSVDPESLTVRRSDGKTFGNGTAMEQLVDAEKLASAGLPFASGTSAFRLAPEQGAGRFVIAAPGLDVSRDGQLRIHVIEPASTVILTMATDADAYFVGREMGVRARLNDGDRSMPITALEGELVSPRGERFPLTFARGRSDVQQSRISLKFPPAAVPGLWEVQATARGVIDGLPVQRNVKTAFAYAQPRARLSGKAGTTRDEHSGLIVTIGVEAASDARYEVRAVLFGTDDTGKLRPIMASSTADWLQAGSTEVALVFDGESLNSSDLQAPYQLRDLRLMDQSQLAVLHRQAIALDIPQ